MPQFFTDLETRRLEEANEASQPVLIRGGAGHPPPTGRLTQEHRHGLR
jgi:hypothetical protein